uniref:Uncharacterized protein n=1 Tax=Helianthus annuus TaxID=4232 RepID=A0A251T613_HELAN
MLVGGCGSRPRSRKEKKPFSFIIPQEIQGFKVLLIQKSNACDQILNHLRVSYIGSVRVRMRMNK